MDDPSWDIKDAHPDPVTGLSVWPCFYNSKYVGRIEETAKGYVALLEDGSSVNLWRGPEDPFRDQAGDRLKGKAKAAQGCLATAVLSVSEVQYLDELPDAEYAVSHQVQRCGFQEHEAGGMHAAFVQSQAPDVKIQARWWLLWNDSGVRALQVRPGCGKLNTGEHAEEDGMECLLVGDHPGDCDDGIIEAAPGDPWTLALDTSDEVVCWVLHHGGESVELNEDLTAYDLAKAQAWANEQMGFTGAWTLNPFTSPDLASSWVSPGDSVVDA